MAVSLSRNLKLRINSNLTADAKYNLERIDLIGANFLASTSDALFIRSRTNVVIEPESPDIDGSGSGGSVSIGTEDHVVDTFSIHADTVNFSGALGFLDQGTAGSKYLRIKYKSDISGSTDLVSNRDLFIDVQGADRNIVLGGNLSLPGGLSVSTGSLVFTQTGNTTLSLPTSGTVATLAGAEALSNKTSLGLSNGTYQAILQTSGSQAATYTLTLPVDDGNTGQVLSTDGAGNLSWVTVAGVSSSDFEADWLNADGVIKSVTHNLGTSDLDVTIYDEDDEQIGIQRIDSTNPNVLVLEASEAPTSSWRVIIQAN